MLSRVDIRAVAWAPGSPHSRGVPDPSVHHAPFSPKGSCQNRGVSRTAQRMDTAPLQRSQWRCEHGVSGYICPTAAPGLRVRRRARSCRPRTPGCEERRLAVCRRCASLTSSEPAGVTSPSSIRARKVSPGLITAIMVLSLFIMKLQSPSHSTQSFQLGVDQQLLQFRHAGPAVATRLETRGDLRRGL